MEERTVELVDTIITRGQIHPIGQAQQADPLEESDPELYATRETIPTTVYSKLLSSLPLVFSSLFCAYSNTRQQKSQGYVL